MNYINEYFFKEDLYKAGLIELEDIARELTFEYLKKSLSWDLVESKKKEIETKKTISIKDSE